jgi:hypothetical protein
VSDGGGNGSRNSAAGSAGSVNTGSGSGGNGTGLASSDPGGSGIVIIRYSGSQGAVGSSNTSPSGGNTIHTYTGDGTFTANVAIYNIN